MVTKDLVSLVLMSGAVPFMLVEMIIMKRIVKQRQDLPPVTAKDAFLIGGVVFFPALGVIIDSLNADWSWTNLTTVLVVLGTMFVPTYPFGLLVWQKKNTNQALAINLPIMAVAVSFYFIWAHFAGYRF